MATEFALIPENAFFLAADGSLASGFQLFVYTAGSSTKATTHRDSDGLVANTNPIVLDSLGQTPYGCYVASGTYKTILASATDTDPPATAIRTRDNITARNDTGDAAEWVAGPVATYIGATSFSLVGDQTSIFHVGRRIKATDSSGTDYGAITATAYSSLTTVTVAMDGVSALDSGLSAVSYASLSAVNPSLPATVSFTTVSGNLTNCTGFPGKNALINGGFTLNQRAYVSGATLASTAYGHDRWKAGSGGGDYSFTQLNSDTTITIASGKTLIQVVEDKNVQGTSYVLSWTGTAQARYAVNSATPTGSYAASPILITGQTAGTTMSVEFNAGTLGKAQLEVGAVASTFEIRSFGTELALCQRYYYAGPILSYGYPSPSSGGYAAWQRSDYKVTMRAAATVVATYSSYSNVASFNAGSRTADYFSDQIVSTAQSNVQWNMSYTATAEL